VLLHLLMSKPDIQFNEKTWEAFEKQKLELSNAMLTQKGILGKFRSNFKQEKGPLQIIINTMNRRQVITYDDKGSAIKKDFLTWNANYHGKDWVDNDLWIREHIHGIHYEPKFKTTFTQDLETGEMIPKKEYNGAVEVYDIELTDKNRKQVIEDIINNCNGSIIDNIKFYGHFTNSPQGPSFRCNLYTYDQFINSSMEELERLGRKQGGPQGNAPYQSKDGKLYLG
jgi:hypothetical protein